VSPPRKKKGSPSTGGGDPISALRSAVLKEAGINVISLDDAPDYGFVSTGLPLLDLLSGGGIPLGGITHVWGNSRTGKTALALRLGGVFQRMVPNGVVFFIDTENALSGPFARLIGTDPSKLLLPEDGVTTEGGVVSVEKAFAAIEAAVTTYTGLVGPGTVLVVWDSWASSDAQEDLDKGYSGGRLAAKARAASKGLARLRAALRKTRCPMVVTNQVRANVGAIFGPQELAPGGRALLFYTDLSIKLREKQKIKGPGDDPIGAEVEFYVEKCRSAPPFRRGAFRIYFIRGAITDSECWYPLLKRYGKATAPGGRVKIDGLEGEYTFTSIADFAQQVENDALLRSRLHKTLQEALFQDNVPLAPPVEETLTDQLDRAFGGDPDE